MPYNIDKFNFPTIDQFTRTPGSDRLTGLDDTEPADTNREVF